MLCNTLKRLITRLGREEEGGEMVEYVLILGLLVVTCLVLVNAVGLKLHLAWQRVSSLL
jgi:Flp pilus assembly pilin Flp